MRLIIFLICLATTFNSFAQAPRLLVKVSPLAAIDAVSFPTITGGVEVHLAPRISMYNEVGIRYRKAWGESADTNFVSPGCYKLKSEFRYYFKEGDRIRYRRFHGHYMGMNWFYTHHKYNSDIEYNSPDNYSSSSLKDSYGVTKSVWGLNLLWGWQDDLGKRFMFEVYEGIGVRFRNFTTMNKQFVYGRDEMVESDDVNSLFRNKGARLEGKGGRSATFNYSTGIRFVYKIF